MVQIRTIVGPVLFLATVLFLLAGCSEEGVSTSTATIEGAVVDPADIPLFGVGVGVLYASPVPSSAPGVSLPLAVSVQMSAPYPNPTRTPSGEELSILLTTDADTTFRLEIWTLIAGVPGPVYRFPDRTVSGELTLTWDGRDDFETLVPNGMYQVRLSVPADPPEGSEPQVTQAQVLLNRSAQDMVLLRGGFNRLTNPDGEYTVTDIAVGASYVSTSIEGNILGQATVPNGVRLAFRDPDYQDRDVDVRVGPGEFVELSDIILTPRFGALIRVMPPGP